MLCPFLPEASRRPAASSVAPGDAHSVGWTGQVTGRRRPAVVGRGWCWRKRLSAGGPALHSGGRTAAGLQLPEKP
uniref:Uncharacterized protein n=1 Tax=Anguilla anguilla TaxID=7936 RepID=A0A0E9WKS7_ANGAN